MLTSKPSSDCRNSTSKRLIGASNSEGSKRQFRNSFPVSLRAGEARPSPGGPFIEMMGHRITRRAPSLRIVGCDISRELGVDVHEQRVLPDVRQRALDVLVGFYQ